MYEATIRNLLYANDDMYEKLVGSEMDIHKQLDEITDLQIEIDILNAENNKKNYSMRRRSTHSKKDYRPVSHYDVNA